MSSLLRVGQFFRLVFYAQRYAVVVFKYSIRIKHRAEISTVHLNNSQLIKYYTNTYAVSVRHICVLCLSIRFEMIYTTANDNIYNVCVCIADIRRYLLYYYVLSISRELYTIQ